MRTTTRALILILTLTNPHLAMPLPLSHSVPYVSSASLPSPHLLPPPPGFLLINALRPPSAPPFPHPPSRPSLPTWTDSKWAALRRGARKGWGDGSWAADNSIPKEFRPPLNHPSNFYLGDSDTGPKTERRRRVTEWRSKVGYPWIRDESLLGGEALEWVFWVLTACLLVSLGLELVPRDKDSNPDDEKSIVCGCGNRQHKDEVERLLEEMSKLIDARWEEEETDVDEDINDDVYENGMEKSSW